MKRARTEWLRNIGILQSKLRSDKRLIFAVTEMNIRFKLPIQLDDMLNINIKIIKTREAGVTLLQSITNQHSTDICDANVIVACLQTDSIKPRRLPESIKAELINDN